MGELGGALRELADRAAAPTPADPDRLWKQGRARVRRRRLTAVVAAAVVVVIGYAGISRPQPTVVMPAGEPHAPAIPKNIYSPTRFLAGVSDEGPPGRLAVIAQKPGDGMNQGPWFGISATTGEYRFLDLPDRATETSMTLSSDGRRIAYWVTGPTRKSTFGKGDGLNVGGSLPKKPTTGVAVYDTTDGTVVQHQVLTDFGLAPDEGAQGGLAWLAGDTLVFNYGVRTGSNTTRFAVAYRWSPVGSAPVALGKVDSPDADYAPALPGDGWITSVERDDDSSGVAFVDADGRQTGRSFVLADPVGSNGDGRLTVNDGRVVGIGVGLIDATQSDGAVTSSLGVPRVSVGELPATGGTLALRGIGSVVDPWFVGWVTGDRVLVRGRPGEKPDPAHFEPGEVPGDGALYVKEDDDGEYVDGTWLYDVNVATGKTRRVGIVDVDLEAVVAAGDLVGEPMVHGDKPPTVILALRIPIAGGVLLLLAGVAAWYRRRRPWRVYVAREGEHHAAG